MNLKGGYQIIDLTNITAEIGAGETVADVSITLPDNLFESVKVTMTSKPYIIKLKLVYTDAEFIVDFVYSGGMCFNTDLNILHTVSPVVDVSSNLYLVAINLATKTLSFFGL